MKPLLHWLRNADIRHAEYRARMDGRWEAEVAARQAREQAALDLIDDLERFVRSLPPEMKVSFERGPDCAELSIEAPTPEHRPLSLEVSTDEIDYSLGAVWSEQIDPGPESRQRIMASLDAIKIGAVREIRDRPTGLIYHIYRLRSRGLNCFMRDSQYSFRHRRRRRLSEISMSRIPPLVANAESA